MTTHYDLVVLGAGPGGYVAAVKAAQLGLSVAVVEEKYWGGVCLNVGCVPAKTLLRNGEIARLVQTEAETFGIIGDLTVDYNAAYRRSRKVSEDRAKGVHYLMRKNGVTELHGRGRFLDPHHLEVTGTDASLTQVTFDKAIIATGSAVRLLPGITVSANVHTYETMILAEQAPRSVAIVGAGAIGVEFAYLLNAYNVDVTLIEYADRILPLEDIDVSHELARAFKRLGITIHTSARVQRTVDTDTGATVEYLDVDGATHTVQAEKVLVCVGFAPQVEGFGIENTGILLTDRGAIDIDEYMRTSVENIYAVGDVTGKLALAHVAEAQAVVAAEHAAGGEPHTLGEYRSMPRATFTQPQVASFGLTEAEARDNGRDVLISTFPFVANAKAHALGDATGFIKVVADAEYGELLGAHLIGHDVSELLPQLTLAHKFELTAKDLTLNVHTHPTMSEAMQEAFHGLVGPMINL